MEVKRLMMAGLLASVAFVVLPMGTASADESQLVCVTVYGLPPEFANRHCAPVEETDQVTEELCIPVDCDQTIFGPNGEPLVRVEIGPEA